MKRKKASKGMIVDIAMMLVCLVCITSCISSGILAKYTTGTRSNDLGRPARFSVSAVKTDGEDNAEITDDGNSVDYKVKVINDSETAVSYDIILTFNMDIYGIVSVKFGEDTYEASEAEKHTITIKDAGVLAMGETDENVMFTIVVDLNQFTESVESGEADIDFDTMVVFTQID